MNINKIAIVHPSRGRPLKSLEIENIVREKSSNEIPITFILSLDVDDIKLEEYKDVYKDTNTIICVNENKGYVDACNNGATYVLDEDLVFVLSDDFYVPENWDILIKDSVSKIPTEEYLLNVSDKYSNREDCAIITILSTKLYKRLGWIYYPEYETGWCDNDIMGVSKALGVAYTDFSIVIEHRHPDWLPEIDRDSTYLKTADFNKVEISRKLYEKRRKNNFGF